MWRCYEIPCECGDKTRYLSYRRNQLRKCFSCHGTPLKTFGITTVQNCHYKIHADTSTHYYQLDIPIRVHDNSTADRDIDYMDPYANGKKEREKVMSADRKEPSISVSVETTPLRRGRKH